MNESIPDTAASSTQAATGKASVLATAAVALSVPGLCITPLGIVALILGIIALIRIANPQRRLSGKGRAVTGIVLGVLSILVLFSVLLPVRTSARNNKDLSHLREIGIAMHVYANDHDDTFPDHPRDAMSDLRTVPPVENTLISPHHNSSTVLDRGDSDGVALRYGSYVFLQLGESLETINSPGSTVLAYTAKSSDRQPNRGVLFVDGHGELIEEQDFRALLPPEVDVDALDGP